MPWHAIGPVVMPGDHHGRPCMVYRCGVWDIDAELIESWVGSLDEASRAQVIAVLRILREAGPQLGRPLVDTVKASRYKN